MVESALHNGQAMECGKGSVLRWQENLGKIHPGTAQGSGANNLQEVTFLLSQHCENAELPLLLLTNLSGADAIVTREQLKVSLRYCRNWKQKAGFECIFCNDSATLVWDAVTVLNFMVILHAGRSYIFFYFTSRKHQYLTHELSKQLQCSQK